MTIQLVNLSEKDNKHLSRLIARGEILPVMNNTKWSELIGEMREAGEMQPQFRLHSVLAPLEFVTNWDGDWHYHIQPIKEIEWLDLRAESQDWIFSTLAKHSIPYSIEDGLVRIWGYTRSGAQPNWHVA